ncbi:MAG: glycosyltransferase family 2 protein [Gammaproteobacteria bacterium]|nr:glycosyltransferase family 2 protein [Gammaproteobacteria bacterium]
MKISVVIPSYNRLPVLIRAIKSVLAQSSPVDEIIVVDDGSDDDTVNQISSQFPQVNYLYQQNSGVSAARNYGIRQAQYPWIAFLDSDDSWLPDKIEKTRDSQQQQPDFLLFHSNEIWIRNGVRVNAMNKHQKFGGWIFPQCLPLCVISPSAVIMKRELFSDVDMFDESLPACEDYDLWLRICHQYPVCYIDKPLITKYGGHEDQLSRRYWGMDRFRIRALRNLLTTHELTEENRRAAQAMLEDKLGILLKGAKKHGNQQVIDEFQPLLATC